MSMYRDLIRFALLFVSGFVLLVGVNRSTVVAAHIVPLNATTTCVGEPTVKWVYKPAGEETDLMLSVTVSCMNGMGQVVETEGDTWWQCTNVGSEPVTKNGTAFVFQGQSGLDCTGMTVQAVVKALVGYELSPTITAGNFYAQAHVQPFRDADNADCVQAQKDPIETYQTYLPVFDDGNITYRLNRTVDDDVFQLQMDMFWVYQNDENGLAVTHDPHVFHSAAFVTDPAAIVRSHYVSGVMTHTEGYGTSAPTVLSSETIPDKTFYLKTDTTKIRLGYDDVNGDSVIDNYYCGYIIDFEVDPINPFGFG